MLWEDVKIEVNNLDIVDVARKLDITLGKKMGAYQMCHCFMHEDDNPSMWLKTNKKLWFCGGCGEGGDNVRLVMKRKNLKYAPAVRWLAKNFNIDIDEDLQKKYQPPRGAKRPKRVSTSSNIREIRDIRVQKTQCLNPVYLNQFASTTSPFCQALVSNHILTYEQMLHAAARYHLGITWDNGVIFWQIDHHYQLLDGKIMFYKPDCHRDHNRHPSWITSRFKYQHLLPEDYEPSRCLFGLHLLANENEDENENKSIVAVVESEKTAIICSEFFPEYIWLATGGLSNLSPSRLAPLRDHKIIIFPDTDPEGKTYKKWQEIIIQAQQELNIHIAVSSILELKATREQKARKIDIADYILESKTKTL